MKHFNFLCAAVVCAMTFTSCSNEDTNTNLPNDTGHEVSVNVKGEIFTSVKASGDDLYAVQVFEKGDQPGDSYEPKEAGIFDDPELIKFSTESPKTYKVKISVVKNGKNVLVKDGNVYKAPFENIFTVDNNNLNEFYANTTDLISMYQSGVENSDGKIYHYSHDNRYFGEQADIAFDAGCTDMEAKVGFFRLTFKTKDDNVMAENTKLLITVSNGLASDDPNYRGCKEYEVLESAAETKKSDEPSVIVGTSYAHNNLDVSYARDTEHDITIEIKYVNNSGEVLAITKVENFKVKSAHEYPILINSIKQDLDITLENPTWIKGTDHSVNF